MSALQCPPMIIAVAAGKGGTGKTLLTTSLALVINEACPGQVQLLDCDVEEPNAHLLLQPAITTEQTVTVPVPQVNLDLCTRCGQCAKVCEESAIAVIRQAVLTFPELCSGCGACSYICPTGAITEVPRPVGVVGGGQTGEGIEFHNGRLNVGDAKATPVTKAVKRNIRADRISLLDAPPGTACPMQETVEASDYCILVTEPTPFGLSDLKVAVETCRSVNVPCGIVINRHGSGFGGVEAYCADEGLPVLAAIPQDRGIAEGYSRGEAVLGREARWQPLLREIVEQIVKYIDKK